MLVACAWVGKAAADGPQIVAGPSADAKCYAPWAADTKYYQYPAKKGPYRIAIANGYIANSWRIQMIKTAKAYASQPAVAANIKEFKVVSVGEDVAAQISAINNFIDSGFDAIVIDANNPEAFGAVIKRAKASGIPLIAFDNVLNSTDVINVNVDQVGIGTIQSQWLIDHLPNGGNVIEVRGPAGQGVDTDRHNGLHTGLDASGKKWNVTEVVGKWDDATAQKVVADAIAVHGHFDGIAAQGGDTGVVQALIDAKHPFVPFAGETENGFRKACAAHEKDGLLCSSAGTGPAQVAVAIKTALDVLSGQIIPQAVKLPTSVTTAPNFKDGVNFYSNQSDNFFVGNAFPDCKINIDAVEIMGKSEKNE
jgi:ribose transport system substrate-binding protein